MLFKKSLGVLLACLTLAGGVVCGEAPETTPEKLIEQLGADDFDVRSAAAKKLAALGEAVRPALEKAALSEDGEVKAAVKELLARFQLATILLFAFDRDGLSAAGAEVELKMQDCLGLNKPSPPETANFGADGLVKIAGKKTGLTSLEFKWKKWTPLYDLHDSYGYEMPFYLWSYIQMLLKPGPNPILFQLTRGGTVIAQALDASGKPLKDAQCVLLDLFKFRYHWETEPADYFDNIFAKIANREDCWPLQATADAEGKARWENVPDSLYKLLVTSENCEAGGGQTFRVHEGQIVDLAPVKLTAKRRGKLQLTLLKDDGTPLKDVQCFVVLKPILEGPVYEERKHLNNMYGCRHRQQEQEAAKTDENGALVKENLHCGKYSLRANCRVENSSEEKKEPEIFEFESSDILITAEQPAEVKLRPVASGALTGQLLAANGKGVANIQVAAVSEKDFIRSYDLPSSPGCYWASTKNDGSFTFKRLPPARYVLQLKSPTGEQVRIYDVEVTAGKIASVPEIKLPAAPANDIDISDVKGKVLLPDGTSAAGISISVSYKDSRCGRIINLRCDQNGCFSQHLKGYNPTYLQVREAGYKTVKLDLQAPGVIKENIIIQLEKRHYGKLLVQAVDEVGSPLAGVAVNPSYCGGSSRVKKTNPKGEVYFEGLADGKRRITINCQGYWLTDEDTTVNIVPDTETTLKVTLHRGAVVSGQVTLPEGTAYRAVLVCLRSNQDDIVQTGPDGGFSFSGVAPGKYQLNVKAPGLILAEPEPVKLTIKPDQKELANLKLRLVRPGAAAIFAGPEWAGYTVTLQNPNFAADPFEKNNCYWSVSATIDAAGRAEFFCVLPGSYNVAVNLSQNNDGSSWVVLLAGQVMVQPLASCAELATLKAQEIKPAQGTATLTLRLRPNLPDKKPVNFCLDQSGLLIGPQAKSSIVAGIQEPPKLIEIGQPPAGMKKPQDNATVLNGLPAGEYKLFFKAGWRGIYSSQIIDSAENKKPPTPLKVFTLKDGESLDLGILKPPIPPPPEETPNFEQEQEKEDLIKVFQP